MSQHRNALHAEAEGESLVGLWINAAILQDNGMHHACPKNGHPTVFAAWPRDVNGDRWLGEWVIPWSEPCARGRTEETLRQLVEDSLQVGERCATVNKQPFDLMELKAVARIDRLVAEAAPRKNDANRRATSLHRADLSWRRMCAQQSPWLLQVEGVPKIARRVILWNVQ